MKNKISKSKSEWDFLNARLDEVRMSDHDRLLAKASLARTQAFADAAVAIVRLFKRLLKTLVVRPYRRLTTAG